MESDRAEVGLGEAVDAELAVDQRQQTRQPKKRFIGRKEAAERAERVGDTSRTIEDSGTVQGKDPAPNIPDKS